MMRAREIRRPNFQSNPPRPLVTTTTTRTPTEDEIRVRAFELFEARGREPGHEVDDWVRAETELRGTRETHG